MRDGPLEITDLLWQFDVDGTRRPVHRDQASAELRSRGQSAAARIVERLPVRGDHLDPHQVDALGIRVHCELQRLEEELQFSRRVGALLRPMITALTDLGHRPHVVDVGCGLGFVLRSLAAGGDLGPDVELTGVDANATLITEASRLAAAEGLSCRFLVGDALAPGGVIRHPESTVVISSGLLHHLGVAELTAFFAAQQRIGVAAFAHWDIVPCRWSTIGAWIFHRARMREPVSRHDGVLSARRSHPAALLRHVGSQAAPDYEITVADEARWRLVALDVLRPVLGVRREQGTGR